MTPQAFADAVTGFAEQERVFRRALAWDPSGGLFELHRKVAGSRAFDLLTSDAAGMLAGVGESLAFTAFMKGGEPLMGRTEAGVVGRLEDRGVGRVLRQQEELEAKLMRATGLMHDVGHAGSRFLPKGEAAAMFGSQGRAKDLNPMDAFLGGATEVALGHDVGHVAFNEVPTDAPMLTAATPAVPNPFVSYRPPAVVPKRPRIEPIEFVAPADLAEVSAADEVRSHKQAVETMLRENDLDHALEDLEFIAVRLAAGARPDRLHAAMSAYSLFEGVANFVFPGHNKPHVDRYGQEHPVEKKYVRNRISAFIDMHLREEISTHDARRLQSKIDYAFTWSAEGHHAVYPPHLASRAYRDTLEVLACVARAWERSLQIRRPI